MVGHNDIAGYINVIPVKTVEPFIYSIICIGFPEERKPFIAGKGDKVNTVGLLIMLKPDGHYQI